MSLRDLLEMKMRTMLDVEQQLAKALPKMAKKANDPDLRRGFERHAKQTEEHAQRLAQALETMGVRPQKISSDAVRGIVADGAWVMKNVKGDAATDAGLIAAGQGAEHFEIAAYEAAIGWAKMLGRDDIARTMQQTLNEEKETSDALMELANSKINGEAMAAGEGEGSDREKESDDDEEEGEDDDKKKSDDDEETEDET